MRVTDCSDLIDIAYRSPEWYAVRREGVTASEIAAVLGISPYQSAFDLWWLKQTGEDLEPENDSMSRGRRYESLIVEDFEERHPEFTVRAGVMVRNTGRPWQMATLDGLACESSSGEPVAVVEIKTAMYRDEWGDPGSDEIPVHYRAQVIYQLDVTGLRTAFVPVLFGTTYAEYVVEWDEDDAYLMRRAAAAFLTSVKNGEQPEVDAHTATTRRLKRLHPSLADDVAEVPATIVRQYQRAKATRDAAAERMRLAENRIRGIAGPAARIAVTDASGKRRTFTHSIYEVAEHVRAASTTDRINFPRKALP